MFIVLLKFSDKREQVGEYVDGHMAWLKQGFDDGVFLLAGRLPPDMGGGILVNGTSRAELENRVNADPFVAENVVQAEIIEMAPSMADDRLNFLVG
jgi:uncharacterized protein YciI